MNIPGMTTVGLSTCQVLSWSLILLCTVSLVPNLISGFHRTDVKKAMSESVYAGSMGSILPLLVGVADMLIILGSLVLLAMADELWLKLFAGAVFAMWAALPLLAGLGVRFGSHELLEISNKMPLVIGPLLILMTLVEMAKFVIVFIL